MDYQHILHPIAPVYDAQSQVLILGSFPSVKSREEGFFYGHPRNRFWRLLAEITGEQMPVSKDEKLLLLHTHHIALWDVISSCDIVGSSDSSITNVIPNDITSILENSNVKAVITNGKTADGLYRRFIEPVTQMQPVCLPSTSPANAAWSYDRLLGYWRQALLKYIK